MKQPLNEEFKRMQKLAGINENFDLSNDEWRNWAINKNKELTYNDLDGFEKSFVDKISDFINSTYMSKFQEYNANKYSDSPPAMFDKQNLTVIGLGGRDIQNLSDDIENKFGDKFITDDTNDRHFIKLKQPAFPISYKLLLNPLFIKKYNKEAQQFYDKAPKYF